MIIRTFYSFFKGNKEDVVCCAGYGVVGRVTERIKTTSAGSESACAAPCVCVLLLLELLWLCACVGLGRRHDHDTGVGKGPSAQQGPWVVFTTFPSFFC